MLWESSVALTRHIITIPSNKQNWVFQDSNELVSSAIGCNKKRKELIEDAKDCFIPVFSVQRQLFF